MKRSVIAKVVLVIVMVTTMCVHADLMQDDASSYSSWVSGDGGGSGFSTWTIDNGGGSAGAFLSTDGSAAIATGNNAWGLWANSGATLDASRTFSNAMNTSLYDTFTINYENGEVANGGSVGIGLRNSSSANRFEFYFGGGGSSYSISDNSGTVDTLYPYTDSGLTLTFQLTGADTYSFTITPYGGGSSSNYTGTLSSSGSIEEFRAWDYQGNTAGDSDFFINSMVVIPEPLTGGLLLLGMGLLIARRKRM